MLNLSSRRSHVIFFAPLSAGLLGALPADGVAQQWQFQPTIKLTADYNDNIRLLPSNQEEIDATSLTVTASGKIVRRDEITEFLIDPAVRRRNVVDGDVDDSTDLFLNLLARRTLRRGGFGIQARASREDVLNAEVDDRDFDNDDVVDPIDVDTGRISVEDERTRVVVSPFFDYPFTENFGIGLGARYLDVSYDGGSGLRDYDALGVRTEFRFRQSQRADWALGVFGEQYESDDAVRANESDTVGVDLGYSYRLGERTNIRLSGGFEQVDSDDTVNGVTTSSSDDLAVFSVSIRRQGEISRIVADVSQAVDPGGFGSLQKRTQFKLRYLRRLSPTLEGQAEFRVQTTEQSGSAPVADRDFGRARLSLEWRLTRVWSLEGAYTYTNQEFSDQPTDADSNAIAISINYQPKRLP